MPSKDRQRLSGEAGIRTLDTASGILVFETSAFNHSATSPFKITAFLSASTLLQG
jgi:hypothetical protein